MALQVARETDLGCNDNIFLCRSHLGGFLKAGDVALGYDLARFVTADDNLEAFVNQGYQLPDVVLVRKCFDEVRAKRRAEHRHRSYKLKHLDMDREDANFHVKRGQVQEAQRAEDLEQFMNVRRLVVRGSAVHARGARWHAAAWCIAAMPCWRRAWSLRPRSNGRRRSSDCDA